MHYVTLCANPGRPCSESVSPIPLTRSKSYILDLTLPSKDTESNTCVLRPCSAAQRLTAAGRTASQASNAMLVKKKIVGLALALLLCASPSFAQQEPAQQNGASGNPPSQGTAASTQQTNTPPPSRPPDVARPHDRVQHPRPSGHLHRLARAITLPVRLLIRLGGLLHLKHKK
jgi:hypothetical protein